MTPHVTTFSGPSASMALSSLRCSNSVALCRWRGQHGTGRERWRRTCGHSVRKSGRRRQQLTGSSGMSVGTRELNIPSGEAGSCVPPPRGGRMKVGVIGGVRSVTHSVSWAVWACACHPLTSYMACAPPPAPSPSAGGGDAGRSGYPRKTRKNQLTFTSTKATNPLHPPFERGKEGGCGFFGS